MVKYACPYVETNAGESLKECHPSRDIKILLPEARTPVVEGGFASEKSNIRDPVA